MFVSNTDLPTNSSRANPERISVASFACRITPSFRRKVTIMSGETFWMHSISLCVPLKFILRFFEFRNILGNSQNSRLIERILKWNSRYSQPSHFAIVPNNSRFSVIGLVVVFAWIFVKGGLKIIKIVGMYVLEKLAVFSFAGELIGKGKIFFHFCVQVEHLILIPDPKPFHPLLQPKR